MRQLFQGLRHGETVIEDVPVPRAARGTVVVRTTRSLVSVGTERMLVEFGKSSLLAKARQQPDKVRQVLDKVGTDGLLTTLDAVRAKLAQPIPLGYCNVGVVVESGKGAESFEVGARVASNGPHAEFVRVPANLCARIPDEVSDDEAAFTVPGSIALQGVRLARPTLGETFAVIGVGLMGLLAVQLLRACGCRVLAVDVDPTKLEMAARFGAFTCDASKDDPVHAAQTFAGEPGVDGVLIGASTANNSPISQAARMCRKRGRIVLVGVVGLELNRAEFYEKELTFQVSCSYGPGRYDPAYEGGTDYPLPFVRWTAQRNFAAVLGQLADGRLRTAELITQRVAFADALEVYGTLAGRKNVLGTLLEYPADSVQRAEATIQTAAARPIDPAKASVALIGAGNYSTRMLIPALRKAGAQLTVLAAPSGTSAAVHARSSGFLQASADVNATIERPDINTVVIATRHDSHATLTAKALGLGKHVFVEKPLGIGQEQLELIRTAHADALARGLHPKLMVGFNRRFAPHIVKLKSLLEGVREPKTIIATVNAGFLPGAHWTRDPEVGGGRIVGEACHFIDLLRFIAGARIVSLQCRGASTGTGTAQRSTDDTATLTLGFEDGSIGTVHYLTSGHPRFPKERIEVFCGGRVAQIDNFRSLRGYGFRTLRNFRSWRQDKGHTACIQAFLSSVENGTESPIPLEELFEVASISIEAQQHIQCA